MAQRRYLIYFLALCLHVILLSADVLNTVVGPTQDNAAGFGCSPQCMRMLPQCIIQDKDSNYFFVDARSALNRIIRKMPSDGSYAFAVAGGGVSTSDNIPATAAQLSQPISSLALDSEGNLYISESTRIRKVAKQTQLISTVLGSLSTGGTFADGPIFPGSISRVSNPRGLIFHATLNALLFIERNMIRSIDLASEPYFLRTRAGASDAPNGFVDNVAPANARFAAPRNLALDAEGNLFVADNLNCVIRRIDAQWSNVSTVAGNSNCTQSLHDGAFLPSNASAITTSISFPVSLSVDSKGNVFFTTSKFGLLVLTVDGMLHHIAGNRSASNTRFAPDTPPNRLRMGSSVIGVWVNNEDDVVWSDLGFVWKIQNPVNVIAQNYTLFAYDNSSYNMSAIRVIIREHPLQLIAGFNYGVSCPSNCPLAGVISSMWLDEVSNLFFIDSSAGRIYKVEDSMISLYAGGQTSPVQTGNAMYELSETVFTDGVSLAGTGSRNDTALYVAERSLGRIRLVTRFGSISLTNSSSSSICAPFNYAGPVDAVRFCGVDRLSVFFEFLAFTDSQFVIRILSLDLGTVRTEVASIDITPFNLGNISMYERLGEVTTLTASIYGLFFYSSAVQSIFSSDGYLYVGNTTYGAAIIGSIARMTPITVATASCVDANNNLYFSQQDGTVLIVSAIDMDSTVEHYLGVSGQSAWTGEHVDAGSSSIGSVTGCQFDTNGYMYFIESSTRIRRVSNLAPSSVPTSQPTSNPTQPTGMPSSQPTFSKPADVMTTYAGITTDNPWGDGCSSLCQRISPRRIVQDSQGDYYFVERGYIKKMLKETLQTTLIIGGGTDVSDTSLAKETSVSTPNSLAIDNYDNLYYVELTGCRLRKLAKGSNFVTTILGVYRVCTSPPDGPVSSTTTFFGSGGLLYNERFNSLFFLERISFHLRLFNLTSNEIVTIAGTGQSGYVDNVHPRSIQFSAPFGIYLTKSHEIYVTDGCALRLINNNWTLITTIAGGLCLSQPPSVPPNNVTALNASAGLLYGVVGDDNGTVFLSSILGILAVTKDGIIHHVAGDVNSFSLTPSTPPRSLRMSSIVSMCWSFLDKTLLLPDFTGGMIWKMSNPVVYNESLHSYRIVQPTIELMAGFNYGVSCPTNCPVFVNITSIYMDRNDYMYVADGTANRIYRVTEQDVSAYVGTGSLSVTVNDWESNPFEKLSEVSLGRPTSIGGAWGQDDFYVAEPHAGRIRLVSPLVGSRSVSSTDPSPETACAPPDYVGRASAAYFCGVNKLTVIGSSIYFTDYSFALRSYDMATDEVLSLVVYSSGPILSLSILSQDVFYYSASTKRIMTGFDHGLVGNGSYGRARSGALIMETPLTIASALCSDVNGNYYFSQEDNRIMVVQQGRYPLKINTFIGIAGNGNMSGEFVYPYSSTISNVTDCTLDSKNYFYFVESRIRIRRISDLTPSSLPTGTPTSQPSRQPSSQPSRQPTSQPTRQPSAQPSSQPARQPTSQPTRQPTSHPTRQPSAQPSSQPTRQPASQPSRQPSAQPSSQPTRQPASQPSRQPSAQPLSLPTSLPSSQPSQQPSQPSRQPTSQPTCQPSAQPSSQPTRQPTSHPTRQPSAQPSSQPTRQPVSQPSRQPSAEPSSQPTRQPTSHPTRQPSAQPSSQPTRQPVSQPSRQPSAQPLSLPTSLPSSQPSRQPTSQPSRQPTSQPSAQPTSQPSDMPTSRPSSTPSSRPTQLPTSLPTGRPSSYPSSRPTSIPSSLPSSRPTSFPSALPSSIPTTKPSSLPSAYPSSIPTGIPSSIPTNHPSVKPSSYPSSLPSSIPSSIPTSFPSVCPTAAPTSLPTPIPSSVPTCRPSACPTAKPYGMPSSQPTATPLSVPTSLPSGSPTLSPSVHPSSTPSNLPSSQPTSQPSSQPFFGPTSQPSRQPSAQPSSKPSGQPSSQPSRQPSLKPSGQPSCQPSRQPSSKPSGQPSSQPSRQPSSQPSGQPNANPTSQPTKYYVKPTRLPTYTPTLVPTQSTVDSWITALQVDTAWISMNDTRNEVAVRRTFTSLRLSGQNLLGNGCSGWKNWLSTDLITSSRSYPISSFELYFRQSLTSTREERFFAICNEKVAATSLFAALTALPTATSNVTSIPCSRRLWKVQRNCSVGALSAAAVCVDCANPCSSSDPLTVAPCSSTYGPQDPSLTLFSVSLQELEQPPEIKAIMPSVSDYNMVVEVALDKAGIVYCGVFRSRPAYVPQSLDEVALQNRVARSSYKDTHVFTVFIPGLIPVTSYSLYCYAESTSGSRSSWTTALQTGQNVTTSCCRKLYLRLTTYSIAEGVDQRNLLSIEVEGGPPTAASLKIDVILQQASTDSSIYVVPNAFVPSAFSVTGALGSSSSSPSIFLRSSLTKLSQGVYRVLLNVTGSSDYEVVYKSNGGDSALYCNLTVLSSNVAVVAPTLSSATYSSDGSFLQIEFSAETNRGGVSGHFLCSEMFRFSCAQSSSCIWRDFSTVLAFVNTSTSCATPNQSLSLALSAAVKARCMTSTCEISGQFLWPNSSVATIVTIASPTVANDPAVVLSMPSSIGSCSSLLIDATASTGNGGRVWKSFKVEVSGIDIYTGVAVNVSSLQSFLQSSLYNLFPQPDLIPAVLLSEGCLFTFQITLCNFLGACGSASRRLSVVSTKVPLLTITGSSLLSVKRNAALTVTAVGAIPSCDGNNGSISTGQYSLIYRWTVIRENIVQPHLASSSRNPSRFLLSPYSLLVNVLYTVSVSASIVSQASLVSSSVASASIQVFVVSGDIVPIIEGGTIRSVRVGQLLMLDASRSYDEDVLPQFASTSMLRFSWTCLQVAPSLSNDCSGIFNATLYRASSSLSVLQLLSLQVAPAEVYWTVVVLDGTSNTDNGRRSAQTTVTIKILPAIASIIQLSLSASANSGAVGMKINALQPLQIVGSVEVPAQIAASLSWEIDSSSGIRNLASVALVDAESITNITLPASLTSRLYYFYLPLNTALLPTGFNIAFKLSCYLQSPGVSSSSSINIFVNSPPRPGFFLVSPEEEVELTYLFSFSCSRWVDDDLPLTYQFGFIAPTAGGSEVVLRSKMLVSFADLALSAGLASRNFTVNCFAQVFDSLQSNATSFAAVRVLEKPALSGDELQNFVLSGIQQGNLTGNVDALKQAASMSSFLMNRVNCSLAPMDCSSRYNRLECYRTPHTCGPCLEGYVGDDGDSNQMCVFDAHNRNREILPASVSQTPLISMKHCPANCSGHGHCSYKSLITQEDVSVCLTGDFSCVPYCQCQASYVGSISCSLTEEQLRDKQELREAVVSGLARIAELEDVDALGLQSLISSLNLVSQSVDEISEVSSKGLLDLASYVVRNAASAGLTTQGATDVLALMQSLMAANDQRNRVRQERRRRARRGLDALEQPLSNYTLQRSQDILSDFAAFAAGNMAPGQNPLQIAQSSFTMHVGKYKVDDSGVHSSAIGQQCNVSTSVSLPSRQLEQSLGVRPTVAALPLCGNSSTTSLSFSLISTSGSSYGNEIDGKVLQANPISLALSQFPCSGDPALCFVSFVFNREPYTNTSRTRGVWLEDALSESNREVHNITCNRNDFARRDFVCSSTGQTYNVTCQGEAEVRQFLCPFFKHEVQCSSLIGNAAVDYGCRVVQVTDENITCSCPLMNLTPPGGRRLQGASNVTVSSGSISVSYVSLLQSVISSFKTTVLSADELNAGSATKGYRVLVTLGTFIAAVVAALIYSSYADQQANKVDPGKMAIDKKYTEKESGATLGAGSSTKRNMAVKQASLLSRSKSLFSSSMRGQKSVKQSASTTQNLLVMAEEALPNVLRAQSFPFLVKQELKRHHRWFGVIFHYSDHFPRVLRVISLATNIVIMLFVQSITYNLSKGDDGTCGRIHNESECLKEPSPYATGESKCYWISDVTDPDGADGKCKFVQPNQSVMIVLFIAIFSALVSIPISLLIDVLVHRILAAPRSPSFWMFSTSNSIEGVRKDSTRSFYAVQPITSNPSPSIKSRKRGTGQAVALDDSNANAVQLFHELQSKLRNYYLQISSDMDKLEFRAIWGLDADGNLSATRSVWSLVEYLLGMKSDSHSDVSNVVFRDVLDVQKVYSQELEFFGSKEYHMGAREKSRRLLYLFQKDLMPGICGQILESKDKRDNIKVKAVSGLAKLLTWSFLFIINTSMLFYIYLFAVSQDEYRQTAWAQSFALWLIAEIFLISTCMVLVMNVAIPSFIMKDVQAIKGKLVDSLVEYHRQLQNESYNVKHGEKKLGDTSESHEVDSNFNAAEYLFVSYRLAQTYAQLKTAKIIARYRTVWPRQSYQHVADVSKSYNRSFTAFTRSASIIVLFFVSNLLTVPMTIQDMVMHMVTTAVAGYTCLLHLRLYAIYPVLVIIPALCILVIIHFLLQSHKTQQQDFHTLLQRAGVATKSLESKVAKDGEQEESSPQQQTVESALKYIYFGKKLRAIHQNRHERLRESNHHEIGKEDLLHLPSHDQEEKSDDDYSRSSSSGDQSGSNSSESSRSRGSSESDHSADDSYDEFQDDARYTLRQPVVSVSVQHVGRRHSVQQGLQLMAAAQRQAYPSSSSNSSNSSASSRSDDDHHVRSGERRSDSDSSRSSEGSSDSDHDHSDVFIVVAHQDEDIHSFDDIGFVEEGGEEDAAVMYSIEPDGTTVYFAQDGREQRRERGHVLEEPSMSPGSYRKAANQQDEDDYGCGSSRSSSSGSDSCSSDSGGGDDDNNDNDNDSDSDNSDVDDDVDEVGSSDENT